MKYKGKRGSEYIEGKGNEIKKKKRKRSKKDQEVCVCVCHGILKKKENCIGKNLLILNIHIKNI